MRRARFAFLAAVIPCASCATLTTTGNQSRSSISAGEGGSASSLPIRRVFNSRLLDARSPRKNAHSVPQGASWGTARLVVKDDDTVEYVVTVYNRSGDVFNGAHLHHGEAGKDSVVATLFSDVTLRHPYVQLRGTVIVGRSIKAGALLEELRERPGSFAVTVSTLERPAGAIRGPIE